MAHSEARGTTSSTSNVVGLEVGEAQLSTAEHLELMNGRLKLDVPHVAGERVINMRGTVPEAWGLA